MTKMLNLQWTLTALLALFLCATPPLVAKASRVDHEQAVANEFSGCALVDYVSYNEEEASPLSNTIFDKDLQIYLLPDKTTPSNYLTEPSAIQYGKFPSANTMDDLGSVSDDEAGNQTIDELASESIAIHLVITFNELANAQEDGTDKGEVAEKTFLHEAAEDDAREQPVEQAPARQKNHTGYLWPVPSSKVITSMFGDANPSRKNHFGLDISAPPGAPIIAVADGVVTRAAWDNSYGNHIVIEHSNGLKTLYAHCSKLISGVGSNVKAGNTIALVGNTGNSTGPHLHIEFQDATGRKDPLTYILVNMTVQNTHDFHFGTNM